VGANRLQERKPTGGQKRKNRATDTYKRVWIFKKGRKGEGSNNGSAWHGELLTYGRGKGKLIRIRAGFCADGLMAVVWNYLGKTKKISRTGRN